MIVGVPVQLPSSAFRVWPFLAVPEIDGPLPSTTVGPAASTTALAGEVAGVVPDVFLAVTVTFSVEPTSPELSL